MKKKTIIIVVTLAITIALIVGLASCENSTVTGSVAEDPAVGISADQISWVSWNQEVIDALQEQETSLAKPGTHGRMVTAVAGGTVGGNMTFGNLVDVPSGAVPSNTFIEVEVVCSDGKDQCGSGIDFLPNMQFLSDVDIILSWEFLDLDNISIDDFHAYYSEDGGNTWFEVENITIDHVNQTIILSEDHFTRYAWGLSINPSL